MDLSNTTSQLLVEWFPYSSSIPHVQQPQFVTAIVGLAIVLLFFFFATRPSYYHRNRLPPGPPPWPLIGNLHLVSLRAHLDFQRLSKIYGPIMTMRLGSKNAIVISSPKIAAEILKTHDVAFDSRPPFTQADINQYESQTVVAAPDAGHFWRDVKKIFTLELLTNRRIQQYQNVRKEEVLKLLSSVIEDGKVFQTVFVVREVKNFLMNNFTRMMINRSYFGRSNASSETDKIEALQMQRALEEITRLTGQFMVGDFVPLLKPFEYIKIKMRAVAKQNDQVFQSPFQRIIDERRRELGSNQKKKEMAREMDMLDILLTISTRKGENEEKPLTDNEINGCLLILVVAGSDTTSSTVEWAMTQLLRNPHIMRKAQDELDTVVGRDRLVEEADIPKLKYFQLIVKEVYRLYPANPIMLPHQCIDSREIAGYQIPVNTQVYINSYAIQRDPNVWLRPLEFDPERFLSTNIDVHGQDFELLPFGAGRRSCPGKSLAIALVNYVLATMLHACNWTLPPGVSPQDVDLEEAPGFGLHKLNLLKVTASPRLPIDVIFGSQH